ncbi:MAG: cobalamin biosynthesis protein, partial [Pseudomonadota bacterium]
MTAPRPVVFWFTASAEPVARRAAAAVEGEALSPEGAGVAETLRAFFAAGRPIVGVCAAGILIRALAPMLGDKQAEPPVLALGEDGGSVVPLLGGHRGANALALKLAGALGAEPALTTAGELRLGVALDAPPEEWRLENPDDAKAAMARLLGGAPAVLEGHAAWLAPLGAAPRPGRAGLAVLSVEGAPPLRYRRPTLALGLGAARGCPAKEMAALAEAALAEAGRDLGDVARVASIDLKSDEAAIHALAARAGVAPEFYRAETLEAA